MKEHPNLGIRRKKDFDKSRTEFHQAAFELLAEKGYHHTSVEDIVCRAGRSKGGFYHHFKSKADLYSELFDQILEKASKRINAGLQTGRTAREVLVGLVSEMESTMTNPKFMRASVDFFFVSMRNEEAKQVLRSLHKKSVEMFARFFQGALERGEIRSTIDVNLTADLLFASSRGVVIISTILNEGRDLPGKLRGYIELLFAGLE
jgi:AcrR family transcriptional regulator